MATAGPCQEDLAQGRGENCQRALMSAVISAVCLCSNGVPALGLSFLFIYFFTKWHLRGHLPAGKISRSISSLFLCQSAIRRDTKPSVCFHALTRVWALIKADAYSNCCPFIFYNWLRWFYFFIIFCLRILLVSLSLHICSCSSLCRVSLL